MGGCLKNKESMRGKSNHFWNHFVKTILATNNLVHMVFINTPIYATKNPIISL